MFTIELLKEAQSTRKDFFEFLSKELPENQENTSFNNVKTHFPFSSLEEIKVKSEEALKQCQNLVLLDKKLKAIASVKSTISAVNSLKIISLKLKNYTSVGLKDLIPLVKEWNQILSNFTKESSDINLDPETTTGNIYSIDFNEIHTIIITEIPNSIAKEIETILSNWTDDKFDEENSRIIGFTAGTSNPLAHLFVSFPRKKILEHLHYYREIGAEKSVYHTYPDRLLNRLYTVLGSKSVNTDFPFSVGYLEELTPASMKYATRVTCILESVKYFIKLHENIPDIDSSKIREKLTYKCGQIVRQLRKNAEVERSYHKHDPNISPSLLDSRLNEICTIISQLKTHGGSENLGLEVEIGKWSVIYEKLEGLYLARGIKVAIEMDKIIALQDSDFPISSCIDDIFYVLKSAKTRNPTDPKLLNMAFCEHFLKVIRKHLETLLGQLEVIKKINVPVKLSRDLVSFIVLINNLIIAKAYWKALGGDQSIINSNIKDLLELGVQQAKSGEDLFQIIRALIQHYILNIFTKVLAKEAIGQLIILVVGDFVQSYCKLMLYDNSSSSQASNTHSHTGGHLTSTVALKHDRELHELTNWLDQQINLDESQSHAFNKSIDGILARIKQSIALFLCETKEDAQELVEAWKAENNCKLRAGEILVILNKIK